MKAQGVWRLADKSHVTNRTCGKAANRVFAIPARTYRGAVEKVKIAYLAIGDVEGTGTGDDDLDAFQELETPWMGNAIADLERLIGASATDAPPEGDDDAIEPTGLCLIDVGAKDIARELADNSWADRAQFFNNALCESLETMGKAVEAVGKKGKKPGNREFLDCCLIAMHGRICEVLDIWGLEVPPDEDAARIFALSGSPEHRDAARAFCGTSQNAVDRLFEPATAFMLFKRMSELSRPGLNELWREHIKGDKRDAARRP